MKRVLLALATAAAAASFAPAADAALCAPEGPCYCPYVIVVDEGVKNIRIEHAQC